MALHLINIGGYPIVLSDNEEHSGHTYMHTQHVLSMCRQVGNL